MVQLTPNKPYVTLRVKFKKVGSLQYISHLDLVRTMHKIIVRARLPLWYTEGFNPKPKMVFAAPLSIGTESLCEFMDIRLIDDIPPDEAMARLNANMTEEMQVLDAYYTEGKLTDLKWLFYEIGIMTDGATEELAAAAEKYLLGESVTVEKKTKPGEPTKTVDIRSQIKSASCRLFDGLIRISTTLSADASAFLNPEYVVSALKRELGILSNPDLTKEYYTIMRLNAYRADMTEFK
ncbi:MAG: TIGR03936 family radical SAM-associated protein [Clostridia bacterium]|nr:TIGR03936 family radical SAM-associated protein [Clostridia bacterium]